MQISQAELEIMQVLWAQPGLGAAEVCDALADRKDWSPRTVKTLLARLVEKGALETEAEGRRYLYTPLITQETYQKHAATSFIERVFGGRAAPLVAHLANEKGLSAEDIEELEKLLGKLKT